MGLKGGFIPRHTEEEKNWAREVIKITLKNIVKPKAVQQSGLLNEYNKKFNKNLGPGGLYTWLKSITDPEAKKRSYIKSKEKKLIFGSKYLLIINDSNINAFETLDEVKECLQNSLVLSCQKIHLYEKKELGIKYDIEIK